MRAFAAERRVIQPSQPFVSDSTKEFTLALSEYERNDAERGDYLSLAARVSAFGFAGHALVWLTLRDFLSFLESLDQLDATLRGDAELVCGWGTQEELRLRIQPHGHSGRLPIRTELSAQGPREEQFHKVSVEFVAMPNTLTDFRRDLRRFLVADYDAVCVFRGEPD